MAGTRPLGSDFNRSDQLMKMSPSRRAPGARSYLRFTFLLPFLFVAVAVSCDGGTEPPGGDAYTLVAVGSGLPGLVPCCMSQVEATGGSLEIGDDDVVVQRLELRCVSGSACTIPDTWRVMRGQLDRDASRVEWDDGRVSLVAMNASDVTVNHPVPPSWGYAGSIGFRFER